MVPALSKSGDFEMLFQSEPPSLTSSCISNSYVLPYHWTEPIECLLCRTQEVAGPIFCLEMMQPASRIYMQRARSGSDKENLCYPNAMPQRLDPRNNF
jgi:hypothetical protein